VVAVVGYGEGYFFLCFGVGQSAVEHVVLQAEIGGGTVGQVGVLEFIELPVEIVAEDETYELVGVELVGIGGEQATQCIVAFFGFIIVLITIAGK